MSATVRRVMVVGPDSAGRGGISSVMRWFETLDTDALPGYEFSTAASHPGTAQRTLSAAWRSVLASDVVMKRIRAEHPDIVHVLVGPRGSLVRKARVVECARRAGARVVVHLHSGTIDSTLMGHPSSNATSRSVRRLLHRADVVATLWGGPMAGRPDFAPDAAWRVVGNALPSASADRSATVRDVDVLFVGRINQDKGASTLVSIASALGQTGTKLCVAGRPEGDGRGAWDELRTMRHVELLGWLEPERIPELVGRARVLIMPSRTESLPVAAIEAMAAGCVVIGSRVGALPEMLASGRGVIVEGDAAEWRAAVGDVLADDIAAAEMGSAAALYARATYSRDAILGQLAEAYAAAMGDASAATAD